MSGAAEVFGWICKPCAGPVLWGPVVSPYASTPEAGRCACCGEVKPGRREWRPLPTGAPSQPVYASDLPKYAPAPPADAPQVQQLSLF